MDSYPTFLYFRVDGSGQSMYMMIGMDVLEEKCLKNHSPNFKRAIYYFAPMQKVNIEDKVFLNIIPLIWSQE